MLNANRGQALGFYVERRADVTPELRSAEQLKAELKKELAEIAAEQAIAKARRSSEIPQPPGIPPANSTPPAEDP